jgi:pyroglutamyl-peptidase
MADGARTILVTGFEPFGGEMINASWEAAQRLEGWRHGDAAAVVRLLPCAYEASVKKLIHEIETIRPEAILMTGQAARRGAACVERFAQNLDDATAPDNDGVLRRGLRISRAAPEWLEATTPVTPIVSAVKAVGIPSRMSKDAGNFVCNHLYFGALHYLRSLARPVPAVFLHLPATPEQTVRAPASKRLASARAADALRAAAAAMIDVPAASEAA